MPVTGSCGGVHWARSYVTNAPEITARNACSALLNFQSWLTDGAEQGTVEDDRRLLLSVALHLNADAFTEIGVVPRRRPCPGTNATMPFLTMTPRSR